MENVLPGIRNWLFFLWFLILCLIYVVSAVSTKRLPLVQLNIQTHKMLVDPSLLSWTRATACPAGKCQALLQKSLQPPGSGPSPIPTPNDSSGSKRQGPHQAGVESSWLKRLCTTGADVSCNNSTGIAFEGPPLIQKSSHLRNHK